MDPDEVENTSKGTGMATVPSSNRQSPPSTETGEMAPALSHPRLNLIGNESEQQGRRPAFEDDGMLPALGAPVLPAAVIRVNIPDHANKRTSIDHVLSSGGVSSASSVGADDLRPPLVIGLNSTTINVGQNAMPRVSDNQQQSGDGNRERGRLGSVAICSAHSMVDRKVLVMREATGLSTSPNPTPLGRQRRLSLFERANSISIPLNNQGSGDSDAPLHAKSDRSNSSGMVKGRNMSSFRLDEALSDHDHPSSIGRDKYNTVLRDWLMHVVEKDDQQNVEEVQNAWATARRRRRLAHKTFEAADYELYDSKVWHTHKQNAANNNRQGTKGSKRQRRLVGRGLTIALGVAVGVTGCFVTFCTEGLVHAKLHFIAHVIEELEGESDVKRFGTAFAWLWFFNSLLTAAAFSMVWYQPWSNGSGIPETKCVLNGVSIPQVLAPSTLVTKVLGVILGVASGLPIGKEGPMIHAGAAIGGGIANIPGIPGLAEFRNDRDRRDLAAMGTSAGVAAAFHTPIGGVLFSLEEGASFWTTFLTWRSFAAAVVTVMVYYLLFQGQNIFKEPLTASDIFLFGEFQDSDSSFYMWELPMFAVIATLGGLLGASFVACSKRMALFRARRLAGAKRRFIEIMVISTVMTTVAFFLPLAVGECRPEPTDLDGWSAAGASSLKRLVTLNCHRGEYNEVRMFCRGIGELLGRNSRAYALVGGAGILGGITRMTLSVTVMMVEASGWVLFVIPLMLVFIVARAVGNRFNEGIYDTQIRIKKMPFLEQEPPEETRTQNMRANQLMSKEVVCLRPIETVEAIMSVLRDYDHNCFPVVEDRDQRVLLGVVYRKNLAVLLKQRHFAEPSAQDPTRPDDSLPELSWSFLESSYPRYPSYRDIEGGIKTEDLRCLMDIAAYVQIGPHSINEHASAHRAYIMFRTLGLRHLVVVNHYNEVMGMITRENLLPEHFGAGGAYSRTHDQNQLNNLSAA
eukprot:g10308.t1